jgi:hypothetical protein
MSGVTQKPGDGQSRATTETRLHNDTGAHVSSDSKAVFLSCAPFVAVVSRNTHQRYEGYFRLEWKLAVNRSHLMSKTRPFLIPVVIDDAPDDDQVPDRFREIQWTQLPGGDTASSFVERISSLLSSGNVDANLREPSRVSPGL